MGKTLVGILEVVVGSALEAIPGGQAIGTSLILTGLGTVAGSLLSHAPKPDTVETAVKAPIPPRVSAYGRGRLYGAYILYETAANGIACDVYAVHEGQMDGPEVFYLGDAPVASTSGVLPGLQDGAYGDGKVEIDFRFGLPTETAFSQVISALPGIWDASHRGDGVVTSMVNWQPVKSADYQKRYPNSQPALSIAGRWQRVFDWRDTSQSITDPMTWKWSENACLHLAHYLLVRDNKDWATHFVPTLAYWTAAANDCDVAMPILGGQAALIANDSPDSDHTVLLSNADGLQPGTQITITDGGNSGHVETVAVTSITNGNGGYIVGISPEIGAYFPQGSSVAWQSTTAHALTEPRYRSCFAHKHTDDHKSVIAGVLGCFDGWLSPRSDGALMVFSGRYVAPTVSIGPDEIVSYSIQEGIDEENAINQIAVTYVSAAHAFNTVDTDAWEDGDDIASRGKVLADKLDNQVPSHSQARRLAKRQMAKVMGPKRGTITTNSAGRIVRGQRFVNVNLTEAGTTFYSGPVEVTKLTRNVATGGVTFDWILADPNIDAWEPETEEGQPAPVGNRVAAQPLVAPVITSAVKDLQAVSGDGTGVRVAITGAGPDRSDLVWFARWRIVGAAVWNEARYPDIAAGTTIQIETGFVPASVMVEVEIAYEQADGRVSPYSLAFPVNTAAPSSNPAHQIIAQSNPSPLSSTDTSISIAAFTATMDYAYSGSTMVSLPSGTLSGLTAGGSFAVFRDLSAGAYLAAPTPALPAFANPNYLFIGYQFTSNGGTYTPPPTTRNPGNGGSGQYPTP